MTTSFNFTAPANTATHLGVLVGGKLLPFFREFLWVSQEIILSTVDSNALCLARRAMPDLSEDIDDVFDEVTDRSTPEEIVKTIQFIYCLKDQHPRTTDKIIANFV